MDDLERHQRRTAVQVPGHGALLASPAVRGFPGPVPGLVELLDGLPELEGRVADLTASCGGGGLTRGPASIEVVEPSCAGLTAARQRFAGDARVTVRAGLPWELRPAAYDAVLLLPPGDRGSDRVRSELRAAARSLRPGGIAYAVMHKDQGAKRYERTAATLFQELSVLGRSRGWRLVRLTGASVPSEHADDGAPWRRFEARGRSWWALPGVFAARGLDVGSGVLLAALAELGAAPLQAMTALDLGCGTGILSHAALAAGAERVVALDDDLAAVRSARRNLAGAPVEVLHSDLDAALAPELRVDAVLVNPPFHVAKQVRMEVARAFLAAARARLRPEGTALIVANRALPYERELATWGRFRTLREERGFKVLRAWR